MAGSPNIILASQSPRRRELMQLITPSFHCETADVEESAVLAPSPAALSLALAKAKAGAVSLLHPQNTVIGCDTVVELDGAALGKPASETEAAAMLAALSGQKHFVHTGVCLCGNFSTCSFVETTTVYFSPIPPKEIAAYVSTQEPYDKAGGYGIQGIAARFIPRIEGCYYNVMGLPVAALYRELQRLELL